MTARTRWERRRDAFAKMTPEEHAVRKAIRAEKDRARHARNTKAGQALEEAAAQEFLAVGAPTKGYSAFLRSQEAAKASQFNRSILDERIAA